MPDLVGEIRAALRAQVTHGPLPDPSLVFGQVTAVLLPIEREST
jgi:hypothetical protein